MRKTILGVVVSLAIGSVPALGQSITGVDPTWADSPDGRAPVLELRDLRGPLLRSEAGEQAWLPGPGSPAAGCLRPVEWELGLSDLLVADGPSDVAFTNNGALMAIAHADDGGIVVLDANTRAWQRWIHTGRPNDLEMTPSGFAMVTSIWTDKVMQVDLRAGVVRWTLALGPQPAAVRVTPGGTRAVAASAAAQKLWVIALPSSVMTRTINGTGFTSSLTIGAESGSKRVEISGFECVDEQWVIHPNPVLGTIDFLDMGSGARIALPGAAQPHSVALTRDRALAVVSHVGNVQRLTLVDTNTRTITRTIATGVDLGAALTVDPTGAYAAAAVQGGGAIVVDLATSAVSPVLATGKVNQLLTTLNGRHALAVGRQGSLISYATQSIVRDLNGVAEAEVGAISPVGHRAALLGAIEGEDLIVLDTRPGGVGLEQLRNTGAAREFDGARHVSTGGKHVYVAHVASDNVSQTGLGSNSFWELPVGDRPSETAVTPDGSTVVVTHLGAPFVTIVDAATRVQTQVQLGERSSQVEISPDGRYAYVAVVEQDGVWRIDLPARALAGPKLPTGDMGGISFNFSQTSGLTLSHDGRTLVACGSFSNRVTIIDTVLWAVAKDLAVGTTPVRALFKRNDSEFYVSNRDSNDVMVVSNNGPASAVTATVPVGRGPFEMIATRDGRTLYVGEYLDDALGLIDLSTGTRRAKILLPDAPRGLLRGDSDCLLVINGAWNVSLAANLTTLVQRGSLVVIDTNTERAIYGVVHGGTPAGLALHPTGTVAAAAGPERKILEGLDLAPPPSSYCATNLSSLGCAATLSWQGKPREDSSSPFIVRVDQVEGNRTAILFFGTSSHTFRPWGTGSNILCVRGPTTRLPVSTSGGNNGLCNGILSLDFNAWARLNPNQAPPAGTRVYLQAWYRDPPAPKTSSLSNAVRFTVLP